MLVPRRIRVWRIGRRRFLAGAAVLATALFGWHRFGRYGDASAASRSLSAREAAILMAAAGVVIPCCEGDPSMLAAIVGNVDRYLGTLPPRLLRRVRLAILVFEQTTAVTRGSDRFTRLSWIERDRYLRALEARGGRLAQVARAVRDLCLVGYYQAPENFVALGYEGPAPRHETDASSESPDPLRAPSGHLPRSIAG